MNWANLINSLSILILSTATIINTFQIKKLRADLKNKQRVPSPVLEQFIKLNAQLKDRK